MTMAGSGTTAESMGPRSAMGALHWSETAS